MTEENQQELAQQSQNQAEYARVARSDQLFANAIGGIVAGGLTELIFDKPLLSIAVASFAVAHWSR